jgi:pimeloyl-ACP methyl ester carboxylesterase
MGGIIIHGIECLPGSYFAARYLHAPGNRVFYRTSAKDHGIEKEIADRVIYAWRKIAGEGQAGGAPPDLEQRLCRLNEDCGQSGDIAAYWYFGNPILDANVRATIEDVLLACRHFKVRELNHVQYDCAGCGPEAGKEQAAVAALARAQGLPFRTFQASLLAGAGGPGAEQHAAVSSFLKVLHSLKAEIEERSPQYFDFHALRYAAPPDAILNLVPVTYVADALLRISERPATLDSHFKIASPAGTSLAAFCERVGIAYGLSLLGVPDATALNAIDRIFHERLAGLDRYFVKGPDEPWDAGLNGASETLPDGLFEEDEQIALFESLRRDQDECLAACRRRAEELPDRLTRHTLTAGGSELTYYAGGAGPAVVVLNALGQGLECWYRLLDNLADSYRVIIWEPRGTAAPPSPFGLAGQVSDVETILEHEGIESCHLAGWCTGPKVAMKFCLDHPSAVRSMVFLNTTFKCDGSPEELDSPYEKNLESLCRVLARKPAMAPMVMKTFQSRSEPDETEVLEGADGEQVSEAVLAQMNGNLRSYVLAPFRTEATTIHYAHQLIDFWACDVRAQAAMISVPVLLVSAEYDHVATPAASREAAKLFPNARYLHVKGATHYCLYDRPEFVAGLMRRFFECPDGIPAQPEQDEKLSKRACACSDVQSAPAASVAGAAFHSRSF